MLFSELPSTRAPAVSARSPEVSRDEEATLLPRPASASDTAQVRTVQQVRNRSPSPDAKRSKGHKPTRLAPLKRDGLNYTTWLVKIGAAMRFLGLPANAENLDPARDQLAIDLLLDSVEEELLQFVSQPCWGLFDCL